jgi:hypothetical protein
VARLAASIALLGALSFPAAAQTRVGARAGASLMSSLVNDSIVQPLSIRPGPGPAIGFWIETRLDPTYTVSLGLQTAWSTIFRHEAGSKTAVVPVSTWTPVISLGRTLNRNVTAYGRLGAIIYRADRTASNLFRDGSPPAALLGAGIGGERPLAGDLRLTLDLTYDVHRFSTPSLRAAGFVGERLVHRVGVSVGVSRGV